MKDKITVLIEFKETQELKLRAEKRYKELKEEILKNFEPGVYEKYVLAFEERNVKEYLVPARTDKIVKVSKI